MRGGPPIERSQRRAGGLPERDELRVLDPPAAGELLDADPREYDRLVRSLTINVTKFFRNWDTFAVIQQSSASALGLVLSAGFDTFGGDTTDVAVTPDGRHVYVTQRPGKSAGGRALVIDTTTQKRVDPPIDLPSSADGLAFMPDGLTAYVTDRSSREVHVIAVGP